MNQCKYSKIRIINDDNDDEDFCCMKYKFATYKACFADEDCIDYEGKNNDKRNKDRTNKCGVICC